MQRARAGFQSTRWTLVFAAGDTQTDLARAALSELCEIYWYPLYAYARRTGAGAEDARDLVQGFLLSIWERDDLRTLSPERGRFRSLLLAALKHYIGNRRVHDRAQKRGGGQVAIPLDVDGAEERYRAGPATVTHRSVRSNGSGRLNCSRRSSPRSGANGTHAASWPSSNA